MIRGLTIKNYTIIRELHLAFGKGLSIITGETGAGKSILLGALKLILGERADTQVLYDNTKKCIVEGEFDIAGMDLQQFFETNDLDYDNSVIVRREILPSGKSRAFVNDTPVTLAPLKELGMKLVEMHRQMDSTSLYEESFQIGFLDRVGQLSPMPRQYRELYNRYTAALRQWQDVRQAHITSKKEKAFLEFQRTEIEAFQPVVEEEESLLQQIKSLEHAQEIQEVVSQILYDTHENESGPLSSLRTHSRALSRIQPYIEEVTPLIQRIESSLLELEDLYTQLGGLVTEVQENPQRLHELHQRYDQMQTLFRKHDVQTSASLIEIQEAIIDQLSQISHHSSEEERLETEVNKLYQQTVKHAALLTKARKKTAEQATNTLISKLRYLGMPEANARFEFTSNDNPGSLGDAKIELLFSANKGVEPGSIRTIASGGELSRLNLCIKSMIADYAALPTLVFDEIDTGISGEIAKNLAHMLRTLSRNHQVITITHSPIVAASGDTHYKVFKDHSGDKTTSDIQQLSKEERITEIAIMMSGSPPTDTALKNAAELLPE